MSLEPGTRLGPYEIVSRIGAGGMGEVYRADDTRLGRTVAIKVLPAELSADPQRRQRFEREARTISNLTHPNICTLYDIGREGETDYLVMELIEGETLAQRLQKGALPLDQALQVAIEIADALDKAHRQGITHRDLKPGNIMLTKAGAKLLDFGLAKLKPVEAAGGLTAMPTQSAGLTGEGAILGTLQYMAPEQLEGKEADARTDIFAFGTTVHEMATGKKAFEGTSQASLIGAILKDEARPISALQPLSPPALDRVVKRCMAKDADDRWQTARDLHSELRWVAEGGPQVGAPVSAPTAHPVGWRHVMPMVATGGAAALITGWTGYAHVILGWQYASPVVGAWAAAALMTGGAVWCLMRGWRHAMPYLVGVAVGGLVIGVTVWGVVWPAAPLPARVVVALPSEQELSLGEQGAVNPIALSPDGQLLVYAAAERGSGTTRLFLRPLDQFIGQPIEGTEGAAAPFFSADGRWIGFFTNETIQKISVSGGLPVKICDTSVLLASASWGPEDTIVFSHYDLGLHKVSASGGTPEPLTLPDASKGEFRHFAPQILPGGRDVLFTIASTEGFLTAILSLASNEWRTVLDDAESARYVQAGHLVYGQTGALLAVQFDLARMATRGSPVPLLERVSHLAGLGSAHFAVSDTGTLAYPPTDAGAANTTLVWVDRQGRTTPIVGDPAPHSNPRVSPDGRQIAVPVGPDIWVYDVESDTRRRLTTDGYNLTSVWHPDGDRITFSAVRADPAALFDLHSVPTDRSTGPELLLTREGRQFPFSWTPDGKVLSFVETTAAGEDIGILEGGKASSLLAGPYNEGAPAFSPDGRWLAYESDETGEREVYVTRYPGPAGSQLISVNGGREPRWSRDGRELFYNRGDRLVVVSVETTDSMLKTGPPTVLFEMPYTGWDRGGMGYDVAPDGQRFVMLQLPEATSSQINVVLHWFEELKRLVPVD